MQQAYGCRVLAPSAIQPRRYSPAVIHPISLLPPALWEKFLFHFERTLADLEALPKLARDRAIRCLRTGGVAA